MGMVSPLRHGRLDCRAGGRGAATGSHGCHCTRRGEGQGKVRSPKTASGPGRRPGPRAAGKERPRLWSLSSTSVLTQEARGRGSPEDGAGVSTGWTLACRGGPRTASSVASSCELHLSRWRKAPELSCHAPRRPVYRGRGCGHERAPVSGVWEPQGLALVGTLPPGNAGHWECRFSSLFLSYEIRSKTAGI